MTKENPFMYMCHIFFVRSSVSGYLDWFQTLAIVNTTGITTDVQISLWYADLGVLGVYYWDLYSWQFYFSEELQY